MEVQQLNEPWQHSGRHNHLQVLGILESQKLRRLMTVKINKKWPGPGLTRLVDRVWPGQFPNGFLPPPGPVLGPSRLCPGSTRRAGPGFKTLVFRESTLLLSLGLTFNYGDRHTDTILTLYLHEFQSTRASHLKDIVSPA